MKEGTKVRDEAGLWGFDIALSQGCSDVNRETSVHIKCISEELFEQSEEKDPVILETEPCHYLIRYANPAACPQKVPVD